MNLYQRLLALTDEAITTLRTIQETQAVALRAHVAAQRASEASESATIFRDAAGALSADVAQLRFDLANHRERDERIAALLGVSLDADLVRAVDDRCKKANERSAAVLWLRERADLESRNQASSALDVAADCIERGEHMSAGGGVAKP